MQEYYQGILGLSQKATVFNDWSIKKEQWLQYTKTEGKFNHKSIKSWQLPQKTNVWNEWTGNLQNEKYKKGYKH